MVFNQYFSPDNEVRFKNIEKRALKIIFRAQHKKHCVWRSFTSMGSLQCADFVFKCINGTAPEVFHNYFMTLEHGKVTRCNGTDMGMREVKTKSGNAGFITVEKILNNLPLSFES